MKLFKKALSYIKNPKNLIWFFLLAFACMLIDDPMIFLLFTCILLVINVFYARILIIFLYLIFSVILLFFMFYLESIHAIQQDHLSISSGIFIYVFGIPLICKSVYILINKICKNEVAQKQPRSEKKVKPAVFLMLLLLNIFVILIACINPYEATLKFLLWVVYMLFSIPATIVLNKKKKLNSFQKIFSYSFWSFGIYAFIQNVLFQEYDLDIRLLGICFFIILAIFNIRSYIRAEAK